jgi:penicillin amidase
VKVIHEDIRVKGETAPRTIELRYTHHGPVIHEDRGRHRAYALRSVAGEPGTAAYLPALSVARANNWTQFVDALRRWRGTGHNFVYADREGNIGWHATGLTPIRKGWNGLLPVPGDSGNFEWSGFVPAGELPRTFNPPAHYIATANQNTIPAGFPYSVTFRHTEPFRFQRLLEIFQGRTSKFTVADFERIQHDITSIPARRFQSILRKWRGAGDETKSLLAWDARMSTDSVQAAHFEVWMSKLMETVIGKDLTPISSWAVLLERLENEPDEQRLAATWEQTVQELTRRLGPDRARWTWGRLHTIELRHPINLAKFHLSPVSRPGDQFTVNQTRGPDFKQEHGASFREVIDLADWDRSTATNAPGEAGDPESPHYADLLSDWAEGRYHSMPFTRKAVEAATVERMLLTPVR